MSFIHAIFEFFLCHGSSLESKAILQDRKDWNKTFPSSLKQTWVGEGRGPTPPWGGVGNALPWSAGQASTGKQAMATQAGTDAPTHHTSRHPNGTFVPLMEAETYRCDWSQAST